MLDRIGRLVLGLLSAIGPKVMRAWADILVDETGKLYAECKDIFFDAVHFAEVAVTKENHPQRWERVSARLRAAFDYAFPILCERLGKRAVGIAAASVITAINVAHRELEATGGLGVKNEEPRD